MMEFKARLLVDSQDPEVAYNELRQALQYTGLEIKIQDNWLRNNEPFPAHSAALCAARWAANKDPLTVDPKVRFESGDPAIQQHLDSLEDEYDIEGQIGFINHEKLEDF